MGQAAQEADDSKGSMWAWPLPSASPATCLWLKLQQSQSQSSCRASTLRLILQIRKLRPREEGQGTSILSIPDLQSLSHHLGAPPSYRTGVQPFSLVTSVDLGWQLENWVGEQSPLKLPQNTLLAGYRYTQAGREPRDIMAAVNMEFWHCANLNSHFNSPSLGSRIPIL